MHTVPLAQPIPVKGRDKYWHLLTGGIAGGVSRTLTSPLERLKILRQTSTPEYRGLSIMESLVKFYDLEGVKGFFRGNGSNIVRIVPFSAIEFYTFEYCKDRLLPKDNPRHKGGLLLCGSLAGIAASTLTYPLDFIRTMLSIQTHSKYSGMWDAGKQVYHSKGFFALYKGLFTSLLVLFTQGITPFIGTKMATFDILKVRYMPPSSDSQFVLMNLVLGGTAGAVATTLTYPTDLVRRKVQLIVLSTQAFENVPYTSLTTAIEHIYHTEGLPGFFRGLVPCYLKVIPAIAIAFAANEKLKALLGVSSK